MSRFSSLCSKLSRRSFDLHRGAAFGGADGGSCIATPDPGLACAPFGVLDAVETQFSDVGREDPERADPTDGGLRGAAAPPEGGRRPDGGRVDSGGGFGASLGQRRKAVK